VLSWSIPDIFYPTPLMPEEKPTQRKTVRERQADYKDRMRKAGMKQITVWVTPEQEEAVKRYLETGTKLPTTPKLAR
jgi:DNA-binding LacI/PurR family transcriptional regulator